MVAAPVLLIDDNVEFVGLLGTLFAEQGITPYLAHSGADAMFQIDRRQHVAIIVDLLLPDTTGHKLLQKMVAAGVDSPIFVMTGVFKGEAQRTKVETVIPIAGWYEKPFDTRLLVERVVAASGFSVVERREHKKVGKVTDDFEIDILDPVEDVEIEVDLTNDTVVPIREETNPHPYWDSSTLASGNSDAAPLPATDPLGTPILVDDVVRAGVESVATAATHDENDRAPVTTASADLGDLEAEPTWVGEPAPSRNPSSQDPFADSTSGFGTTTTPSPAQVAEDLRTSLRSGALASTSVPRLINAFFISQETGEIAFERGRQRKIVYFENGRPVYAVSNQSTDRLGVFAKRFTSISQRQLDAALETSKERDKLLGDVLIDMGLIDPARRTELLREQTRGLVRSLFTWSSGRYVVGFNAKTNIERVDLTEHPGALVLSGVRDLFESRRLRALVADELRPIPCPNPPFGFEQLPLYDAEAMLVLRVTGARTVRDLVDDPTQMLDGRAVRAVIYALLCLGVFGLVAN